LGVLLACIALLGALFYQVIAPFLLPLFLAAILAMLCRPYYLRLLPRVWNRSDLAAGITTGVITVMIVAPLAVGTFIGAVQILQLSQKEFLNWDWSRGLEKLWIDTLEPGLQQLQMRFPDQIDVKAIKLELADKSRTTIQSLATRTFSWASSTVGALLSLLISGGMFLVAFYYFLADGPALVSAAEALIPLPLEHLRRLQDQFAKVVRAVVLATFLAAFAQGIATAVALQVVGMGHFFVFLIAAMIASLIPLAGTWMVWGPCALWLAYQGHYGAAIGLALFGIIVVGLLDNVVRTYVLNSDAQLHPLLAFVSVLGALQVMGLWGIFFGPIIASCLYAMVQIFRTELAELSLEHATPAQQAEALNSPVPLPQPMLAAPVDHGANNSPAAAGRPQAHPQKKKRRR
jgi:predicted PurR-regulated permease PerM